MDRRGLSEHKSLEEQAKRVSVQMSEKLSKCANEHVRDTISLCTAQLHNPNTDWGQGVLRDANTACSSTPSTTTTRSVCQADHMSSFPEIPEPILLCAALRVYTPIQQGRIQVNWRHCMPAVCI